MNWYIHHHQYTLTLWLNRCVDNDHDREELGKAKLCVVFGQGSYRTIRRNLKTFWPSLDIQRILKVCVCVCQSLRIIILSIDNLKQIYLLAQLKAID
ncbi:unnamed protein product [Onchocerca flexuosa]|uniref:Uncharacterized protein n=1 Tax=Onchocerca flexuosa TaxID=387005 RepID=A0A183I359_9BILA|nr:unnamed protein product [Onchocerca flexuosa]